MKVEYITHMGDDLMVVNAARCSFNKWQTDFGDSDTKLIRYLAKNGHWSPFSHPQIQVRVTVPIFIANQLKRSVVGFALNEVSRRYVDDAPTFYTPTEWRGRPPKSIKQGSSDEVIHYLDAYHGYIKSDENGVAIDLEDVAFTGDINTAYNIFLKEAKALYNNMLRSGVAPEMARMVLPQSMNTSWIWTGSLAAFCRVYKQRKDSHAQKESQIIADQIGEILKKYFPVSFEALTKES